MPKPPKAAPLPLSFTPNLPEFSHQEDYLREQMRSAIFALFWEQGAAKSKPVIENTAQLFLEGVIDAMIVVAPRGADRNWANEELPKHLPPEVMKRAKIMCWRGNRYKRKWHQDQWAELLAHKGLAILTIQYASFNVQHTKNCIWKFLRKRKVFYVLDESSGIKKPSGKRAIAIQASGRYAPYKRILDGTPVAEGPFDVFMPVKFLNEKFWRNNGMWDFNAYKNRFGRWLKRADAAKPVEEGGLGFDPGYDKLIEYQNLGELNELLMKIGSRVLKEEVFDLPPKLYGKLEYEISDYQRSLYDQLKEEYYIQFPDGALVTAELAIVRMLRFQQILCGYLPTDKEPSKMLEKENLRLGVLEDNTAPLTHQGIIWCRFIKDIDLICEMLGNKATRYDGRLDDDELERSKVSFQRGDKQWFVANSQMSSSLTLHMAHTVFFYSNSFKLRDRLQAEDRAHRAGLTHSVDYRDIVAADTVDVHIVRALRDKLDISRIITGDKLKEWI